MKKALCLIPFLLGMAEAYASGDVQSERSEAKQYCDQDSLHDQRFSNYYVAKIKSSATLTAGGGQITHNAWLSKKQGGAPEVKVCLDATAVSVASQAKLYGFPVHVMSAALSGGGVVLLELEVDYAAGRWQWGALDHAGEQAE
ncbi:hypothetical protein CK910_22925 [Aeromonas sp. CA23]|uniref:hypothetical protein n=1 Tax=Aeromonas sp. CA23 TaxID=2033032 RepID=UPI000BFBA125|nr:hypothetical protein [Aeromonas sp. CA23]ATM01012.1 hypothetical protein CK910_22925 [Aeromonas sp. CA23]